MGNVTIQSGIGLCSKNVSNFNCSDKGDDNYFKWRVDDGTNVRNTSDILGPNITADDVIIYYVYGNDSRVNRSDNAIGNNTLLIVRVNDTIKNVPANATVTFYVTNDGNNFLPNTNTTNSSGYANYYFNPDCLHSYNVGIQKWKGSVTDTCYVQQNTTNYTLEIKGDFDYSPSGYRQSASSDITILRTEQNITLDAGKIGQLTIKDDCGSQTDVDNITMQTINNVTSDAYNCTEIDHLGAGVYRCNRNTSDMKARWYDVVVNVSKDYFNNKSARTNGSFFIETAPLLTNSSVGEKNSSSQLT
jgi:hypothetical protein